MHIYIYDNLNVTAMTFLGDFVAKHSEFWTIHQLVYVIGVEVVLVVIKRAFYFVKYFWYKCLLAKDILPGYGPTMLVNTPNPALLRNNK